MGRRTGQTELDLRAAVNHDLRRGIIEYLAERDGSPSEIAAALGLEVERLSYHVQVLVRIGLIKLVKTEPVRGAVKHTYRLIHQPAGSPERDSRAFAELSPEERALAVELVAQRFAGDVALARAAGLLGIDPVPPITQFSGWVDPRGMEELRAAQAEATGRMRQILDDARRRLRAGGAQSARRMRVATIVLEVGEQ